MFWWWKYFLGWEKIFGIFLVFMGDVSTGSLQRSMTPTLREFVQQNRAVPKYKYKYKYKYLEGICATKQSRPHWRWLYSLPRQPWPEIVRPGNLVASYKNHYQLLWVLTKESSLEGRVINFYAPRIPLLKELSQLIPARAGNDENYEIALAEMMPISS